MEQCCWTTSPSTWLQRTKEESPVAFPLALSFGHGLVLAEGSDTSNISPFLGKQFSLLQSFAYISLIIFLKILNCSRVESSEVFLEKGGGGKKVHNDTTIPRVKVK